MTESAHGGEWEPVTAVRPSFGVSTESLWGQHGAGEQGDAYPDALYGDSLGVDLDFEPSEASSVTVPGTVLDHAAMQAQQAPISRTATSAFESTVESMHFPRAEGSSVAEPIAPGDDFVMQQTLAAARDTYPDSDIPTVANGRNVAGWENEEDTDVDMLEDDTSEQEFVESPVPNQPDLSREPQPEIAPTTGNPVLDEVLARKAIEKKMRQNHRKEVRQEFREKSKEKGKDLLSSLGQYALSWHKANMSFARKNKTYIEKPEIVRPDTSEMKLLGKASTSMRHTAHRAGAKTLYMAKNSTSGVRTLARSMYLPGSAGVTGLGGFIYNNAIENNHVDTIPQKIIAVGTLAVGMYLTGKSETLVSQERDRLELEEL